MFVYIRWFTIISCILVICAAFFVGREFREIASQDLIAVVNNNNVSLAEGFINTSWKTCRNEMKTGLDIYYAFRNAQIQHNINPDEWKNYKGYQEMVMAFDEFSRCVFRHFEDISVADVRIYSPDRTQLVSTAERLSLSTASENNGLFSDHPLKASLEGGAFEKARKGDTISTVLENQMIPHPNKKTSRSTLIKTLMPLSKDTFVPILVHRPQNDPGEAIEAIIEIRYDVTEQWQKLSLFQQIGTGGVISIFVVVLVILWVISHRAETIIAKQHEANLELAAQAASAQAENRDKSQFLANVSHELRTPLNAIIGFSEFIKSERSGPIGNDKYGEYITDIHSSGVHLLSLINDILDYSKAEADKLELEVAEVDVTKTVKNSMRLISPRAETAQVQLIEGIPRDHFILKTDAKKLKQVMLNLLSNAVKFTPAGGSVTVTMWQNVVDGSLSIEVKDTGIGIAPKDISRAMAPFGQVDSALSRKYEGTGLGLPLTRKFVEIMGGTFNIKSEVGKGTIITIMLPKEAKGKALSPHIVVESLKEPVCL